MTSPTIHSAQRVAAFVLEAVQKHAGPRWNQGPRQRPLPVGDAANADVIAISQRRLFGVSEPAAQAICAWHAGLRPAVLLDHIPTACAMMQIQAQGQRYVSVVGDDVALAHGDPRHPDGLSFILHDLCHLEKFVDPNHHAGQVGFFAALNTAMTHPQWRDVENGFDATWEADRDYVLADMNGSAVFLFAALKMKLKMAARRHVARAHGRPQPGAGPLSEEERRAYEPRRDLLLRLLGLPAPELEAARAVSARRSAPAAAALLLAWFEGSAVAKEKRLGMIREPGSPGLGL
ncbi:MAG: hypothetical protein SF187_26345 [Deltaproteobacteria bacterium]|nr:hypothetical protein [Deltaproteobacteria bacterium]